VSRVLDFKTQHIGPEELLVAGKLEFETTLTTIEISAAIDDVEAALRAALPLTMHIYLEPDIYDPARVETTSDEDTSSLT
jgi:divalent metal cation (Fe/Co/Zn/Cd) transporter